jgi:hypothetical protein
MNINPKVNEILTNHGLDFQIEKQPLTITNSKGELLTTNYFGLINTKSNEVINTVKDSYTVSQNADIVQLMLEGMEPFGSQLSVSKAGALNGGRKVFLQLEVEGFSRVGDDMVKRYVTLIDSNDGSTSLSIGFGDFCMRCSNQFYKFYKKGEAKFRHTESMQGKIKTIPTLIQTSLNESLRQIETYNKMASTSISKSLADKMVKHLLDYDRVLTSVEKQSLLSTRSINIMDKLYADIETEFKEVGQNMWGLLGGVTRFTTHNQSIPKRDNGRMESLLINGSGYKMNQKALQFAELHLV